MIAIPVTFSFSYVAVELAKTKQNKTKQKNQQKTNKQKKTIHHSIFLLACNVSFRLLLVLLTRVQLQVYMFAFQQLCVLFHCTM